MEQINNVILEGNLTRDPYKVELGGSARLVKFDIANNRRYQSADGKMKDEVLYLTIQSWNGMADACLEKLRKGMNVRIVGTLKQNRWEKNGEKRTSFELSANHIEYGEAKTPILEGGVEKK